MKLAAVQERAATVLEAVVHALARAAIYNRNAAVAPIAVLWADEQRQWEPMMPLLRNVVPHLLTLGPYAPELRIGPAIWVRCMVARTLEANWSEDTVPIVYMPGISRQSLRDIDNCPSYLQPLAGLQYGCVYWVQQNGRDWTLLAFLKAAEGGLALDVAQDVETLEALYRASLPLADTRLEALSGRRLEAQDFDQLLTPDSVRDLLRWLDDPHAVRGQWGAARWKAFCARCIEEFRFNPETDGELVGAERVCNRDGAWQEVWARFTESPRSYPNLCRLMRRVEMPQQLFVLEDSWPQANERREGELREALLAFDKRSPQQAVRELLELEERHGRRREWVWAELGEAPLAFAMKHLAQLAEVVVQQLGGATIEEMSDLYANNAWRADGAAVGAGASVAQPTDVRAVSTAIRAVYLPWLEQAATRVQQLVEQHGLPQANSTSSSMVADIGECILFADGLRLDVAHVLTEELTRRGYRVGVETQWIGLPSVTGTSKPAVSPIAGQLTGQSNTENFQPSVTSTLKPLTAELFRKLMTAAGYQILDRDDVGDPGGRAWTELGDLDRTGHSEGWKLANRLGEHVRVMADRVEQLMQAGWRQVHVVTDHGWLLVPGGLAKSVLPHYLAATRWGRCAVLTQGAQHAGGQLVLPWFWSSDVRIAVAAGATNFYEGQEYAHGGLSLQECVTPRLAVAAKSGGPDLRIDEVSWLGLRCRAKILGGGPGTTVDIRTKVGDPSSTLVNGGKTLDEEGRVSLLIDDDKFLGVAAFIVVLRKGEAMLKQSATIGGGD